MCSRATATVHRVRGTFRMIRIRDTPYHHRESVRNSSRRISHRGPSSCCRDRRMRHKYPEYLALALVALSCESGDRPDIEPTSAMDENITATGASVLERNN